MAKILSVALCLTLIQVSLARPDQASYFGYEEEVSKTGEVSPACQESLINARQQLHDLITLSDNFNIDFHQAVEKVKDCFKGSKWNLFACIKDNVTEKVEIFLAHESHFRSIINDLLKSISSAIKNCLGEPVQLFVQTLAPLALEYVN